MPQSIDLTALLRHWMRGWARLCVFVVLGIIAGFVYLHFATYRYTVTMEIASTDQAINPSLGESFSLLRTGVTFGVRTDLNMELFLDEMTSIEVANRLAADPEFMHVLFESRWDAASRQWRPPSPTTTAIKKFIGMPYQTDDAPSADDVQRYLEKTIEVRRGPTSPVATLVIMHKNRDFALKLLRDAYNFADDALRAKAAKRAQERVDFLQDYLAKSTITEYRYELAQGLMDQVKTLMAGKLPSAFAVYIVSGPWSNDLPNDPSARSVLLAAMILGFVLGSASLLVFPSVRQRRHQAVRGGFGQIEREPL